jgi:hypothetical protein
MALWSGVEDVQRRHHGSLPDVAAPASGPAPIERMPPVRFQVPAEAGGVRGASGLASALFDRTLEPKTRRVQGRIEPPPAAGSLWIAVFGPTLLAGPVRAAGDGSFVLERVPDAPVLLVVGDDPLALRSGYRRRLPVERPGDVDLGLLEVPAHALDILVVTADGVPVRGAVAWLTSREDPEWRPRTSIPEQPAASRPAPVGSGAGGTLRIEGLPGGRFELHVLVPGHEAPLAREVSLPRSGTVTVAVPAR